LLNIELNDGVQIPAVGFGVFLIPNDGETYDAVSQALQAGYRHIDTAAAYMNESDVGKAVRDSGIPREDIFITSKLWIQDYGYDATKKAIQTSLNNLNMDYIDLYLLHQPYSDVLGAWKALEEAKADGLIKSIGISNMTPKFYKEFVSQFETKPSVNQVEFNPYFQQKELRALLAEDNVKIEAWAPLGQGNADLFKEDILVHLSEKYNKNVGQIILKFEVQEGMIVLPKSVTSSRIESNIQLFDFELTEEEMEEIRALDKGKGNHDPDAPGVGEYLLENYKIHE